MKFSALHYAKALLSALSETDQKSHDKVLDNFVKILQSNGDLSKYPEIENEFNLLVLKAEGIKPVNITTAKTVNNPEVLKNLNHIIAGNTKVKTSVDSSMIGGIMIRSEDILFDSSLKTQLNHLNQSLKS